MQLSKKTYLIAIGAILSFTQVHAQSAKKYACEFYTGVSFTGTGPLGIHANDGLFYTNKGKKALPKSVKNVPGIRIYANPDYPHLRSVKVKKGCSATYVRLLGAPDSGRISSGFPITRDNKQVFNGIPNVANDLVYCRCK